ISKETSSTIGEQRRFNSALQPMTRDAFVRQVTTDLPEAPDYFRRDVEMNRIGAVALEDLPPLRALSPDEVEDLLENGASALDVDGLRRRMGSRAAWLLDVRRPAERENARIRGAVPVPLNELPARTAELDRAAPVAAICAGGYRSSIASSVLERAGFTRVANV